MCIQENAEFTDDPCGAFGAFGPLVGTGLLQAGEAIKTLLKINQTTEKLLLFNAHSLNFDRINLTKISTAMYVHNSMNTKGS